MFLVCSLLISLIVVAIVEEQKASNAEQAEFVPVPVKVERTRN